MIDIKSVALGVTLSVLLAGGMVVALFFFSGPQVRSISHKVVLPSGKTVEVTMCNFAWGVEHAERDVQKDSFVLEYVSTVPHTDLAAVDGVDQAVVSPAAISITAGRAGCSYRDRTDHTG